MADYVPKPLDALIERRCEDPLTGEDEVAEIAMDEKMQKYTKYHEQRKCCIDSYNERMRGHALFAEKIVQKNDAYIDIGKPFMRIEKKNGKKK